MSRELKALESKRIKHDRKVIADLREPVRAYRTITILPQNGDEPNLFRYSVHEKAVREGMGTVEIGESRYNSRDLRGV